VTAKGVKAATDFYQVVKRSSVGVPWGAKALGDIS
jgi:hypothetical protein